MDRTNLLYYILCWMYIYMQMFYGLGIAHILYFCNASCRSVENVVIMVMMIMMTMMSSRRRRGYLRTSLQNIPHVTVQPGAAFEGGKWGDHPRPHS